MGVLARETAHLARFLFLSPILFQEIAAPYPG